MNDKNKQKAYLYVGVQAIILGLLVFLPSNIGPTISSATALGKLLEYLGFAGIIASAYTIRKSLTALPTPKSGGQLGNTGLYKYVRHPMYTSVLILSLGIAVLGGSVIKYALVVCLYVLFLHKSKFEESLLREKYPEYHEYAQKTPRFFPGAK
jgi:protein-S-isoprenylcysteine O-methyltransferase Ste14